MFRTFFLSSIVLIALQIAGLSSESIQINASEDSDLYIYYQTNTTTRNYMNVGQYYGGRSTHYYVGLAKWNGADLSPLTGKTNVALNLYVQNFVNPVFGSGGINSQPIGFTNTTTGNFTLKVVALSGNPDPVSMTDGWVKTNMINVTGLGSVTLTNAGYNTINIGDAVTNWIPSGNSSLWLGFIGTQSTTSPLASIQLGTLEPSYDLDGSILAQATPMYLSVPSTAVPPAPVAQSYRILSGNRLEMVFETVPNISYALKTKSYLSDPAWVTVGSSFQAGSTSTTLIQSMTNSAGRGFYRLEIAP